MITDEMLREALYEVNEALLNSLPPEEQCEHEFSPRFHRRMARLIRRASHPHLYRTLNRAAGFLLALVLTGTVWLSVDARARDTFFGWLRETYETFFAYRYAGERREETETRNYRPTELPEDWAELDRWTDESGGTVVYTDGTDGLYHFTYTWVGTGVPIVVETKQPKEVSVGGGPAEFYAATGSSENAMLVWTEKKTGTFFVLSAALSQEEMIEIAESVTAIK